MKALGASLVLLSLALSARPAEAQWSPSVFRGLMLYDGSLMLFENGVQVAPGIDDKSLVEVYGLRLAYQVAPRLQLEGGYGRSGLENAAGDLTGHFYQAVLAYDVLAKERWTVHLGGGLGAVAFVPEADDQEGLSDPTILGAIGGLYRATEKLGIRADLRFTGQFCNQAERANGLVCNDGSQLGYTEFSMGVRYRLR